MKFNLPPFTKNTISFLHCLSFATIEQFCNAQFTKFCPYSRLQINIQKNPPRKEISIILVDGIKMVLHLQLRLQNDFLGDICCPNLVLNDLSNDGARKTHKDTR
jgi:hypothetical protein